MPKPGRKTAKIKTLAAKKIASSDAKQVRAGYIGETEKLKGAPKKA